MRSTHINPKISSDTYLQGIHDFNRVPFPPPGILTVIHKSPDSRESYAPHVLKGWYVGGYPEHYRCFDIWCPDTRHVRQGKTVSFFPHDHVFPGISPHENSTRSIHELIAALQHPHPASPTAKFGIEQTHALIQLSRIVHLALPVPKPTIPTIPPITRWSGPPAPPPRVTVPTVPPVPRVPTAFPLPRVPTSPPPPRVLYDPAPPRVKIHRIPPWPTPQVPPQRIPTVTLLSNQTCNLIISPSCQTYPYHADLPP